MSEFPSFLRLNNLPLYVRLPHILLIHSSVHGCLGGFHDSAIVNNAAMNMTEQILLQGSTFNFGGQILRNRIAGSYGNSIINFLRNRHTVCHSGCIILFLRTVHKGSCFSTSLPKLVFWIFWLFFFFFNTSHPNGYEVVSRCSFDFHFSDD